MNDILERYYQWLIKWITLHRLRIRPSYNKLLKHLWNQDFYYSIPMDQNRYEDGIELRYHFARDCNEDERVVAQELDRFPCSVLEMMVALALRIETQIMVDDDKGNRTGEWFWEMIRNLDLLDQNDAKYNMQKVNLVMERFLNREYRSNGEGGLFTIHSRNEDMTKVEIWYQAMWYLSELNE